MRKEIQRERKCVLTAAVSASIEKIALFSVYADRGIVRFPHKPQTDRRIQPLTAESKKRENLMKSQRLSACDILTSKYTKNVLIATC